MEIPIRLQILCTILLLLSVVHWGDAQFYGSYGRSAYFAPITFPQTPDYNAQSVVPVMSRVSDDFIQPQPQPQPQFQPQFQQQFPPQLQPQQQVAASLTSKQISKGSEQFAFEMFSVSAFLWTDQKLNFRD